MKTLRASIIAMLREGYKEHVICARLQIRPCVIEYVIETDSEAL